MDYADVIWSDEGAPHSRAFADVYFSRESGRAETELVFLGGCGLPEGWANTAHFTIGETGFGSGLNFLHAWQRFEQTARADAKLTFISVEQFPLRLEDLSRAHDGFDADLAPYAAQLRAQYPLPIAGWHRLSFGRVTLLLGYGDATQLLSDYDTKIDAWFLDGFSPAKNPHMWQPELYQAIADLSAAGARLASFTAAGHVRAGLEAVGFSIEREKGFAHKRHRITGVFAGGEKRHNIAVPTHAILVGGGLAGASMAHSLAVRGARVTLLERASGLATGASGNQAGVLYPQLTNDNRVSAQFTHAGYAHTLRLLVQLPNVEYATIGMLKTPKDGKEAQRLAAVNSMLGYASDVVRAVDADEASTLMGVRLATGGAWYAHGTWVRPKSLCEAFASHPNITVITGADVTQLVRDGDKWRAQCADGTQYEADIIVLATAQDTQAFAPQIEWRMHPSAGQISLIPNAHIATPLRAILCHRGYIIPQAQHHMVGATYDHTDFSCKVSDDNHARNRDEVEKALPNWLVAPDMRVWQGRTSLRATTVDRMPYLGKIDEGYYVSAGHGSRGLVTAPLAAEILAAQIMGEPIPASRGVVAAINAARLGII